MEASLVGLLIVGFPLRFPSREMRVLCVGRKSSGFHPCPSASLSYSLANSSRSAGPASRFWILIPPGRRITRPSAYDFIRSGNWLCYSPSDHERGASLPSWRVANGLTKTRDQRNNVTGKRVNARQNIDKSDHPKRTAVKTL